MVLRALREENGLTIRQVSDATGITERTINMLEKGSQPSYRSLVKLADFFGVSTDYILNRATK